MTTSTIRLMDADGSNLREVFAYTPVNTGSEFRYYALPTWEADASSLFVVIPPPDLTQPDIAPSTIWRIHPGRRQATMIGEVTSIPQSPHVFSPDSRYLAYLEPHPDYLPGDPGFLMVTSLTSREDMAFFYPESHQIYNWSPDSERFAFLTNPTHARAMVGQLFRSDVIPVYADAAGAVIDVKWVDDTRYLFLAQGAQGWDIMLGKVEGVNTSIATVTGAPPSYDVARQH